MARGWICDRCQQIHTGNPTECRSCGHHILRPATGDELRDQSTGADAPEPMDLDDSRAYGSSPDEELHSGPDLNPDGSIKQGTETPAVGTRRRFVSKSRRWRWMALVGLAVLVSALVVGGLIVTGTL